MAGWWLELGCDGACGSGTFDELKCWPTLPQTGGPAVAWILEHGCPDCGSLDVTAEVSWDGDDA